MPTETTPRDLLTPFVIAVVVLFAVLIGTSSATGNAAAATICAMCVGVARARRLDPFWWMLPSAFGALMTITLLVTLVLP